MNLVNKKSLKINKIFQMSENSISSFGQNTSIDNNLNKKKPTIFSSRNIDSFSNFDFDKNKINSK